MDIKILRRFSYERKKVFEGYGDFDDYRSSILILVSAIFQLIAGIMGVKNCNKPEKAQSCLVMGIIVALLSVAGNVISNVLGSSFNILSYATGLIIPVLYIIGAAKNKTSA